MVCSPKLNKNYFIKKMNIKFGGKFIKVNIILIMVALASLCITVFANDEPPIINNLSSDKTSPQDIGTIITWTANASDPDGEAVLYRFFLNDRPMMDWVTDNEWIWATNDSDVGSNRIEVQIRDGKHAGANGLDDMRSADFMLNVHPMGKIESSTIEQVTLILYIETLLAFGDESGPPVHGALVTGEDGYKNCFQMNTGTKNSIAIKGVPGTWSLSINAPGYWAKNVTLQITNNSTKHILMQKMPDQRDISPKQNQQSGSIQEKNKGIIQTDIANPASVTDTSRSLLDQAELFYRQGDLDRALTTYNEFIELNPENGIAWNGKGEVLRDQGKMHDAVLCFEKSKELGPSNYAPWYNEVMALIDSKSYIDKKLVKINFDNSPTYSITYDPQSVTYVYDTSLEIAANLNPQLKNTSQYWYYVGTSYTMDGDQTMGDISIQFFRKAVDAFNKALEIDPNFQKASQGKNYAAEQITLFGFSEVSTKGMPG